MEIELTLENQKLSGGGKSETEAAVEIWTKIGKSKGFRSCLGLAAEILLRRRRE
jgi:hypothetical protein